MKTIRKITGLALFLLLSGGIVQAGEFAVDNTNSLVKWNAKKVTGEHFGKISVKSGNLEVRGNEIKGGSVEIDMNTIVDEDIKNADMGVKLVGHLKSDDFFSVGKFPVSKIELTGSRKLTGNEFEFTGNLTIKGITNPVTFKAASVVDGKLLKTNGTLVVNRAKYDIRYGSGSFFQGLGDKMIYDDFTLEFNLVAEKK
jgi:polyisoprenoid-binding protein YceI